MSKGVMYVDNIRVEYDNEPNVLEVCRKAGVEIPNFCFHSDLSVYGACRMCMVEEEGTGKIDAACTMPPKNELHIRTNTARAAQVPPHDHRAAALRALPRLHHLREEPRLPLAGDGGPLRHPPRPLRRYARARQDGLLQPRRHDGPQQVHPLRRLCARLPRGAGRQQSALCRPWPKPAHRHGGQ